MDYQVYATGEYMAKCRHLEDAILIAMRYPETVIKWGGRVVWNKRKDAKGGSNLDHYDLIQIRMRQIAQANYAKYHKGV